MSYSHERQERGERKKHQRCPSEYHKGKHQRLAKRDIITGKGFHQ